MTPSDAPLASSDAKQTAVPADSMASTLHALDSLLRRHAERWLHTPYEFGGASFQGVDCSGLIQRVYADALGVTLPRTTSQQLQEGTRVRPNHTIPGDLVFFQPEGKSRHAGIVLAGRQFLHASSSRGVMISPLDIGYWSDHVTAARRILPTNDIPRILALRETELVDVPDLTRR